MTSHKKRALSVAVVALALLAATGPADAQFFLGRKETPQPIRRTQTFSVSGIFSGQMSGQILVDGVAYRLAGEPRVYLMGVGFVSLASLPIGARVTLTGPGTPETGFVRGILVRPLDEESRAGANLESKVRERTAPKPQ